MTPEKTSVFALADPLSAKADPTLIGTDEDHFAAIAAGLEASVAELSARLTTTRLTRADHGQTALERDLEVHRLSARLRALSRFGVDLCLGRMVTAGAGDPAAEGAVGGSVDGADADGPMYVGRLGLTDADGRRLLLDWRSPAAEPFFGATHGNPMGLASRRRYRWTRGRVTDYWDEVFTPEGLEGHAALDDQSAFIASLGGSRSTRMRDVLGTIQADQDAIIRAGSRGALVVDGGPGTGKTVVALHRTAYLLYADPRLGHRRGGVLFVGPHDAYLAYVADVLPSLGEEGVRTCTVADLVPEGASAPEEADPDVARLKARADLVGGIETAVAFYEETPPPMDIDTDWGQVHVSELDWAAAFDAPAPGTPHNEARETIWGDLVWIVHERLGGGVEPERLDASLREDEALTSAVYRAWPTIEPTDLVGDLWSVPAYLRLCAPGLSWEEIRTLQRAQPQAWTRSDLPYLDAARRRLGDPDASRRERRRRAVLAYVAMTRATRQLVVLTSR
ncbi:HelD family protein [Agilicoccus flavus]|uniref:HelD family protein n=1 Tax=Agilicoccus flavus TaxID=2775968 RepID=UPI003556E990